jgi:YggT family protein
MALLSLILQGLRLIILADVILSWVMRDPNQFPRSFTRKITEPLYAPIHAILDPRKTGGMDWSPLIVLLLLSVLQRVILP